MRGRNDRNIWRNNKAFSKADDSCKITDLSSTKSKNKKQQENYTKHQNQIVTVVINRKILKATREKRHTTDTLKKV